MREKNAFLGKKNRSTLSLKLINQNK